MTRMTILTISSLLLLTSCTKTYISTPNSQQQCTNDSYSKYQSSQAKTYHSDYNPDTKLCITTLEY